MIAFWCFILIMLGAVGIVNDLLVSFAGQFDYIIHIAVMFVSIGLLFNSYRKSKKGTMEKLKNRIKELEEQLGEGS